MVIYNGVLVRGILVKAVSYDWYYTTEHGEECTYSSVGSNRVLGIEYYEDENYCYITRGDIDDESSYITKKQYNINYVEYLSEKEKKEMFQ